MHENDIGDIILTEAVRLHRCVGPGLLESVYESILERLLLRRGLQVERQAIMAVSFEDMKFDEGFRADLVVEHKVLIELKSVQKVSSVHKKQLLTYLRLGDLRLGYLMNFGESLMKDGITRIINGTLAK